MMVNGRRRATLSLRLAAVVLILAGSFWATMHFRDRAQGRADAALALAEFETQTFQLGRAAAAAIAADPSYSTSLFELVRVRPAFDRAGDLALRSLPTPERAELDSAIRPYVSAVDKVTTMAANERNSQARAASDTVENPAFARLRDVTESLSSRSQPRQAASRRRLCGHPVVQRPGRGRIGRR
jgi:hypothetical protein